jgi:hypothetical protein
VCEHDRQVHRVIFENVTSGWEGWMLLQTDEHWDNKECDLKMLRQHHEQAVEKNAPILKFGDTYCAMQGKWDRRADQNQLREEHRGNCYLDKLVDTAGDWYAPYAKQIALITPGNHETSIVQHHQTDLTERLAERLRQESGSSIHVGGYWGYVRIQFEANKTVSKTLHYHHGYGGGGEVTRGFIDNNRTRGQYDADIYISGHIHRRNMDENIMTRLQGNKIIRQEQLFLRGATYKREVNGWHAERGRSARPIGAWWLRFRCKYVTENGSGTPEIEVCEIRAS